MTDLDDLLASANSRAAHTDPETAEILRELAGAVTALLAERDSLRLTVRVVASVADDMSAQAQEDGARLAMLTDAVDRRAESREQPLRIWWNKNLDHKISRGKLAAHAAHAALAAYGITYTHPIVVLAAGKAKIEAMPITIRDAGHTELEPGTLTTGVEERFFSLPIIAPCARCGRPILAADASNTAMDVCGACGLALGAAGA